MLKNEPIGRQWRFGVVVMTPILLCLIVAVVAVLGFVAWTSHELDNKALRSQSALMTINMGRARSDLVHALETVAISNETYDRVETRRDLRWLERDLGRTVSRVFGHDGMLVLDGTDAPVIAALDGTLLDEAGTARLTADLHGMVHDLRHELADGQTPVERSVETSIVHVTDFMLIAGEPTLVSVVPITREQPVADDISAPAPLLASIVRLDERFAARMAVTGLLESPRFERLRSGLDGRSVYPLIDRNGRFVAFAEWDIWQPGRLILDTTTPALVGAFLVTGIIVFLLIDQLWRYSVALEDGRRRAQHQATHDPLTGLFNRTYFDEALGRALVLPREPGNELALLMLDLDRFKLVNDTLGHTAGDDLLRAVGQRLRELVGPRDTLARLGGDEFAIMHLTRRGETNSSVLSQRIIDALGRPFEVLGSEVFVGVSIGIVRTLTSELDRREVTRKADIALYEAKSTGRNRAVVFEPAMNDLLQNRHKIEAELRDALRRDDQLSVAFQPLYSQRGARITGAEALVRWKHPELGQVSPANFVPVAESTGLIEALGDFVLRDACRMGGRWPGMTIAVNISPAQMRNPRFPERVFALLAEYGMRAADLELEITEGLLLDDEPTTSGALRTLRAAGVKLALDDFGTGYSSLNYLKRYPVNRIKIDRSFVSQLAAGAVSTAIVQAMITLAHALGIETTAEGVETREQMQLLATLGCNTFQGFLFSPPVDAESIEALFGSERRGQNVTPIGSRQQQHA